MTYLKCNDTGWYKCDYNHSTIYDECCKHNKGFCFLSKFYTDAGKWACIAGCGFTLTYKQLLKRFKNSIIKIREHK